MRLGTTDPIVLGIARCTNTVVAAEISVKRSDDSSGTSIDDATLMETPQTQSVLSTNIVPDYTIYSLMRGVKEVCLLAEVKTDIIDDSVCQSIGYNIARRASGIQRQETGEEYSQEEEVRNPDVSNPELGFSWASMSEPQTIPDVILSSVAKIHAACSHTPHNVLH